MKIGDLIWQRRMPGGECLLIEIWDDWKEYQKQLNGLQLPPLTAQITWSEHDFPVLRVLHPTEGLITDPSYYYETLEELSARK